MTIKWKRNTALGGLRVTYEASRDGKVIANVARAWRPGGRKSLMQGSIPEYFVTLLDRTPHRGLGSFATLKAAKAATAKEFAA